MTRGTTMSTPEKFKLTHYLVESVQFPDRPFRLQSLLRPYFPSVYRQAILPGLRYRFHPPLPSPTNAPARRAPWRAATCATRSTPSDNSGLPEPVSDQERWLRSFGWSHTTSPETSSAKACACPEK